MKEGDRIAQLVLERVRTPLSSRIIHANTTLDIYPRCCCCRAIGRERPRCRRLRQHRQIDVLIGRFCSIVDVLQTTAPQLNLHPIKVSPEGGESGGIGMFLSVTWASEYQEIDKKPKRHPIECSNVSIQVNCDLNVFTQETFYVALYFRHSCHLLESATTPLRFINAADNHRTIFRISSIPWLILVFSSNSVSVVSFSLSFSTYLLIRCHYIPSDLHIQPRGSPDKRLSLSHAQDSTEYRNIIVRRQSISRNGIDPGGESGSRDQSTCSSQPCMFALFIGHPYDSAWPNYPYKSANVCE